MPEWMTGLFVVVLGGVIVSAIAGNLMMYRQVGELKEAVEGLKDMLKAMSEDQDGYRQEVRAEQRVLHKRIDRLKESGGC